MYNIWEGFTQSLPSYKVTYANLVEQIKMQSNTLGKNNSFITSNTIFNAKFVKTVRVVKAFEQVFNRNLYLVKW